RTSGRERAVIVSGVRRMRVIFKLVVARGDSPGVRAVTRKMSGIASAILEIDQRKIAVVFEIICIAIANVRIETHIGVMGEKERTTGTHPDVEFNSFVSEAVRIMIAVGGAAPAATIIDGDFRLAGPTCVVKIRRNRMSRRSDCKQIND